MISKNELKFIKSLKVKKYRVRERRFIVEGSKNVLELIKSEYKIDVILCTSQFASSNTADIKGYRVETVSEKILEETGTFKSNNTCLAVAFLKESDPKDLDFNKLIFVLDGVSDPGNLGTIIRTLDWFGYNQIVCSFDSSELFNPKVLASSMGSFVRTKVVYTDLEHFMENYKAPKYGATVDGNNLFETTIITPCLIVMGSESHGISSTIGSKLDQEISIPKYGSAESLNVGIATGIIANHLRKL